jgi:hypothetical protein
MIHVEKDRKEFMNKYFVSKESVDIVYDRNKEGMFLMVYPESFLETYLRYANFF